MAFEWLQEGAQARRAPEPGAEVVATAGEPVRVTLRERRGEWARVRLQRQEGWVHLPSAVSTEPPLGRDPLPPGPLPGRAPEPEVLEQALEGLPGADEGSLGPFLFYTDVEAPELLRFLGAVATRVEGAYGRRTGLLPRDQPRAAVVLYSREEAYRDFQQSDARLAGLDASGHAGSGVVAFYRQGRSAEELGGTLVHELTHLLNRRAIGPALPLWLDEGLSEDLGLARLSPDGVLEPGSWSGAPRAQGSRQLYSGGQAAVLLLRDRAQQGTLLPLRRLTTTDGTDFTGSRRSDLYAQSALFVRFLMDGDPALEPRFRDFLQGVAAGGSAGSEALGRALDRPWAELDQDFRAWVLAEAARVETGAGGSP